MILVFALGALIGFALGVSLWWIRVIALAHRAMQAEASNRELREYILYEQKRKELH